MNVLHLFPGHVPDTGDRKPLHPVDRHADVNQLQFDFGDDDCRLVKIAITDTIHGTRLTALVADLSPEYVLDLRDVLRFDLPGLSRDLFFSLLSHRGVRYARAPVGWHALKVHGLSTGATLHPRLHHEAVERWQGNLLLLVSRAEHALHTQSALNMAISASRPRGWSIERVD